VDVVGGGTGEVKGPMKYYSFGTVRNSPDAAGAVTLDANSIPMKMARARGHAHTIGWRGISEALRGGSARLYHSISWLMVPVPHPLGRIVGRQFELWAADIFHPIPLHMAITKQDVRSAIVDRSRLTGTALHTPIAEAAR
jgi:hypothetical protein